MTPGFEPTHYNQAVAHLVEEMGEALAAAGKTLRFGPLSSNPLVPAEQRELNDAWLSRELDDVIAAIERYRTIRCFVSLRNI